MERLKDHYICIQYRRLKFRLKIFIEGSFYLLLGKLFYRQHKEVWIISERYNEARDNGYHLFRYIRENYPDKEVYYTIDTNCNDFHKVSPYGNVIKYNSFKHKLLFTVANKLIFTHVHVNTPWNYNMYKRFFKSNCKNKKNIFIQHGITYNDVSEILGKKKCSIDYFLCGAQVECNYIRNILGYSDNEVILTGFPRFDNLHNGVTKNQILIMPSWRMYLEGCTEEEFIETNFFKNINGLLSDRKLNALLLKYKINLVLYLHYQMQKYVRTFKDYNSDNIVIALKEHYDVQKLLRESKLLITDYSSVFFDFAYMNKPVIYFHFDKNDFYQNHYKKGQFNFDTDGFGEVKETVNDVVLLVEKYILNGFRMESLYFERVEKFFGLRDSNNCLRVFRFIDSL